MNCIIYVAKTKTLISFAVTAELICVFVFRICKTLVFSSCSLYMGGWPSWSCDQDARSLDTMRLHIKFYFNLPSGFKVDVWNCWRRTTDGRTISSPMTFGSAKLKTLDVWAWTSYDRGRGIRDKPIKIQQIDTGVKFWTCMHALADSELIFLWTSDYFERIKKKNGVKTNMLLVHV